MQGRDLIGIILTRVQTFHNGRCIHIVTTAQNADQVSVQISYPRLSAHHLLHSESQQSERKRTLILRLVFVLGRVLAEFMLLRVSQMNMGLSSNLARNMITKTSTGVNIV